MITNNNRIFIKNKEYNLCKSWHVIFSFLLDFILSSIIPLIFSFVLGYLSKIDKISIFNSYLILLFLSFFIFFIYFIIIPFFCNTKTFARMLFGIILYSKNTKNNDIKFYHLLIRESFFIFIPWFIAIFLNVIIFLVLKININSIFNESIINQKNYKTALLIIRISSTFYIFWYLILILSIIFDKKNQVFFDYYLQILLLRKTKIVKNKDLEINEKEGKKIEDHIHLKNNQPGNIDLKVLNDLTKDLEKK